MLLVCICSTQAAVKKISDELYTPLWCDSVSLSHTHTHTHTHTHYVQNSAFEVSIANTWTNNKTYLQLLIQKHQNVIAKSEFTLIFYLFILFLEKDFVHSQSCTLLGSQNSRPQNLGCAVLLYTNLNQWFLISSTFRRPNKVLLLSLRNTQRLHDMAASTLLRLLKPRLLSLLEHLGGITQIYANISTSGRRHVGPVWMSRFSPVWISLLF